MTGGRVILWRRALVRRAQYVPRQNRSPRTITPRSVCIAYLALTMCRVRARTHDWRVPANPASTDRDTLELLRPLCPSYKHHVRLRTRESGSSQPPQSCHRHVLREALPRNQAPAGSAQPELLHRPFSRAAYKRTPAHASRRAEARRRGRMARPRGAYSAEMGL